MINLNFEAFVILYEIMEDQIKEFTYERRGKRMTNTDMELLFMLFSTMKIGSRWSLAANVFRSKTLFRAQKQYVFKTYHRRVDKRFYIIGGRLNL